MSDFDLVPKETQEKLLSYRDVLSTAYWDIGDIANSLYAGHFSAGHPVTKQEIFSAIGVLVGKSARTIREYAGISILYPVNIREKYSILIHSHFVFAMAFPDREFVLNLAMDMAADYGYPPTVEQLSDRLVRLQQVTLPHVPEPESELERSEGTPALDRPSPVSMQVTRLDRLVSLQHDVETIIMRVDGFVGVLDGESTNLRNILNDLRLELVRVAATITNAKEVENA